MLRFPLLAFWRLGEQAETAPGIDESARALLGVFKAVEKQNADMAQQSERQHEALMAQLKNLNASVEKLLRQ